MNLNVNDYQKEAISFAIYPKSKEWDLPLYPALGLAGEAGEVAEKIKKLMRDTDAKILTEDQKREIAKELGDVLWYVANLAADIDYDLEEIAGMNIEKLQSRKERNALKGSGDNR
jgi:NTP pyrophosphatase (non-canonical NTP hydrolase)